MSNLLEGKVALVTGAGHGIGRSHALELAGHGAKVVVNDLGSTASGEGAGRDADVVVDIINERGGAAVADYGDVSDENAANAMVQRGIDAWGKLDIVVNNAGIVRDRAIWNMPVADFDLVMNVHLRGSWLTSRAAAIHWRERAKAGEAPVGGRIVNTVSGAGLVGNFGQSNYATAKAAIMGLTLTTSLELASIGCTVNAIGPGALTRISAGTVPDGADKVKEPDELDPDHLDRFDPRVSSPVVAWLVSDEADHISGQCFRAMGEKLYWMEGWTEKVTISNNGKHWDATTLGRVIGSQVMGYRAPGLTLGG
jgi:NAD(P)-dependent dehydrogenase (short-subunit alcohol dehydrogenase family)